MIEVNMPRKFKSLQSLERWMKDFMFNPLELRVNANDRCVATTGETIYDRYDRLKAIFLGNDESDVNDDISYDNIDAETPIFENAIEDITQRTASDQTWEEIMFRVKQSEDDGYPIMIYTKGIENTYQGFPKIQDYTPDMIEYLEDKYRKLNNLSIEIRNIANINAQTILGLNNDNLYSILIPYLRRKSTFVDKDHILVSESYAIYKLVKYMESEDISVRELSRYRIIKEMEETEDRGNKYVSLLYSLNALEDMKSNYMLPFFSPNEMDKFGVFSGDINLYSDKPDNTQFNEDMTVQEWYYIYKDHYGKDNNIHMYEWSMLLKRLYSDYESIIESDDLNLINARKQSILELGWNPEIPFSLKNNPILRHYNLQKEQDLYSEIDEIVKENKNISNSEILDILQEKRVRGVDYKEGVFIIKTLDDVNTEFFKCNRNLKSFEKAKDYESMKPELCKLKYLDNFAVRKMKNRHHKDYKQYADAHARIVNVFNKYLIIVVDNDPDFSFSEYYKQSEWYDEEIRVSESLLKKLISLLMAVIRKN